MQIHQLTNKNKQKEKRIGRGGRKGTYSGRGLKGQISRAGANFQPIVRYLLKRYPKLRGYRFETGKQIKPQLVDVSLLNEKFADNEIVSVSSLIAKKIIHSKDGNVWCVKILGNAKMSKKLRIAPDCSVSAPAKKSIEEAGGKILLLGDKRNSSKSQTKKEIRKEGKKESKPPKVPQKNKK